MKTAQSGLQANTALINRHFLQLACWGWLLFLQQAPFRRQDAKEHPLKPAMRMVEECRDKVTELSGYEATFVKREVVGSSLLSQELQMKVRHEPFSVYLYFKNPHEGREVIFVEGKNNNNLLAHETGFASLIGTLELSPDGSQAMSENRYPVTKAGMANMLTAILEQWEDESKFGECDVKYYPSAKIGESTCKVIESTHPTPRKQFRFHITRVWIDSETGRLVRIQQFGFPPNDKAKPPVMEDYTFTNVKADVRLTDRDFDVNNPKYNY